MQKQYVFIGVAALVVVVAAASLAVDADRPRLKSSENGPAVRTPIPTDLPPVDKLPAQTSLEKAPQRLQFDDGSCESGLGAGITVTAWVDFDVPTQCVIGGLQVVAATAKMNTGTAFAALFGQAGAAPPAVGAGTPVGLSSPIPGNGPCPTNQALVTRGITGATVTGTANFFFGLQNTGFIARDTNGAPAAREWLNCEACGMTQYSPGFLDAAGLGGNFMLRVTVEDTDCLPAELEGACCLDWTECEVLPAQECAYHGWFFMGVDVECPAGTPSDPCGWLYVTLHSTSAVPTADGGVAISWTTEQEIDTVGFRVLREDTVGSGREKTRRHTVVAAMVPAQGNALEGATYEVIDGSPEAARATRYLLQDIDVFGKVTEHDPIMVDRGSREARDQRRAVQVLDL